MLDISLSTLFYSCTLTTSGSTGIKSYKAFDHAFCYQNESHARKSGTGETAQEASFRPFFWEQAEKSQKQCVSAHSTLVFPFAHTM